MSKHIYNVNDSVLFKYGELLGKDNHLYMPKYIVTSKGYDTISIVHGF